MGGPAWIDSERFDIVATMERPPQFDQAGMLGELIGMLRALVEERFGVKAHNEQREGDVYTLTFARSDRKTGAGLRQVPDACAAALKELTGAAPLPQRSGPPPCSFGGPPGRLIGTGVTIAMFASVLSGNAGRTVIDRTGLAGSFDIELNFDPASAAQAPPGAPPGPPADRRQQAVDLHRPAGTARAEARIDARPDRRARHRSGRASGTRELDPPPSTSPVARPARRCPTIRRTASCRPGT